MKPAATLAKSFATQLKEFTQMVLWISSIALLTVSLRTYLQKGDAPAEQPQAPAAVSELR
jgi:hypothetical protein